MTPSLIRHNSNGRFLAIVGEGEYVVYTSRQLRSKAFGEGTDFVWRPNSNAYCVQIVGVGVWGDEQNESTLRLYDDFKERRVIQVPARITALYEGACLGINCAGECVCFYDWERGALLRRVDGKVLVRVGVWGEA